MPVSRTAPRRAHSCTAAVEVRDLLAVLRAIDDPTDALALVSALRSSLFGCGDDDLFVFHVEHGGDLGPHQAVARHPARRTIPSPKAIAYLAALHDQRLWLAPSELIERIVEDRHVLELGSAAGRFRDIARRIRFIVDQAALVLGSDRRNVARVPRVGAASGRRRRPSRRDRVARDRRRRGAHHAPCTARRASSSRSSSSRA